MVIFQTLEPPQYVYWYHNDKIINYDTKRTRVSFDLGKIFSQTPGLDKGIVNCREEQQEGQQQTCDCQSGEG